MKRDGKIRRTAIMAAGVLAIAAAGYFWLRPLSRPLAGLFFRLGEPLYAAGAGLDSAWKTMTEKKSGEPADLRAEMDVLKEENAKLKILAVENEDLKAAAGFREHGGGRTVMARVVSGSGDDSLQALLIDRGAADGIRVGQAAIVDDGVLIGKISDVRSGSATVLLLSDSRSRVAVSAKNIEETVGVLEGDRGLSMSISLIPQTTDISPGDVIMTSGIEPGISRGLAVGIVEKVEKSSQAPFQSATVKPFFAARHPIFVQILTPAVDGVDSGL